MGLLSPPTPPTLAEAITDVEGHIRRLRIVQASYQTVGLDDAAQVAAARVDELLQQWRRLTDMRTAEQAWPEL